MQNAKLTLHSAFYTFHFTKNEFFDMMTEEKRQKIHFGKR